MRGYAAAGLVMAPAWNGVALAHRECGEMCGLEHHGAHERGAPGAPLAANQNDARAMDAGRGHGPKPGPHMKLTAMRKPMPGDREKAEQIVRTLRGALEKYRDHRVAARDGYEVFNPELRMKTYHFTSWKDAAAAAFGFDPAKPTSLLYEKVSGGYTLVGAMYTAPHATGEDQLHRRVPLSVAQWHAHVNICAPRAGAGRWARLFRFGLRGSSATAEACETSGGTFMDHYYGWMLHVFPWEKTPGAIWSHPHGSSV